MDKMRRVGLTKPYQTKITTDNVLLDLNLHQRDIFSLTLAKTEIIYPKNVREKVAMDFT